MALIDKLAPALAGARAVVTAGRALAAVMAVSAGGALFVISHEGTEHQVYLDPVGIPTVCTGHTSTVSAKDVGKQFSSEVCANLLRQDLVASERAVKRLVKQPITQAQYDALVSFTFNVGASNLASSTLLKKLNAGQCLAAAREFNRWVYARGVKLAGLVRRRHEESAMFATGCVED
jgi:lysozyme